MNHLNVSLVKSALRIVACYFLAYYDFQVAAGLLATAELLGIADAIIPITPTDKTIFEEHNALLKQIKKYNSEISKSNKYRYRIITFKKSYINR
jgi:hypothetical protein